MKYDVVIVGSGLGGLECAYILGRKGYNVCLIEKNRQLGGCLQTFTRDNCVFDTGMHYIGSMDEGQILNRFFSYFGLTGRLRLKKLDEDAYEIVRLGDKEYKFAMGYDRFSESMVNYFPKEYAAIRNYTDKLKEINQLADVLKMNKFPGQKSGYFNYYSTGLDDYLNSITGDQGLKNVLLGISPLYAGVRDRTPLYIPMIIHSTYVESAYRFIDGGSQISDLLSSDIIKNGGTIFRRSEVTKFIFDSRSLKAVEVNNSEKIEGRYFISNIHPKAMFRLFDSAPIRPAYHKRIDSIEDTYGIFTLYLVMRENSFEYINSHYYVYKTKNVWEGDNYDARKWPENYFVHFSPTSKSQKYTDTIIVNAYMNWNEVKPWEHTFVEQRGDEYKEFKQKKAEKLLDAIDRDFPGIRSKVKKFYTSTPLTYRDYTGTHKGSIYGVLKDYNNPLKTLIMPKTNVPNLFLTGQNINIHGVIGVTIGSLLTCAELAGAQNILNEIQNV